MVDQVYNAVYKHGADCQKRLIAFQDGICCDDKENPGADVGKVKDLIENLNNYDQNINLVKITQDSTGQGLKYEILQRPDNKAKFNKEDCPTAEQFTEAEIWQIYFWPSDHIFQEFAFQPEFDADQEYGLNFEIGGIGIDTEWKNDGAVIIVTDNNAMGKKLEHIWETAKDEIMEMFRGCDIELLFRSGRIEKLSTTVFDKPIAELTGTPWREKMHYAGLLYPA
jgi:hypothetical protein